MMYSKTVAGEQCSSRPIKAVCTVLAVSPHGLYRDCLSGLLFCWGANMLTQERLKELVNYDPTSGEFTWKIGRKKASQSSTCGRIDSHGYKVIGIDYSKYRACRLAFLYMDGKFPDDQVDHINRDKKDDRWCNLRNVTSIENNQNTIKKSNNTSGYKGVSWSKKSNKWLAQICFKGKRHYLGHFDNPENASTAYKQAASKLHSINPEGAIQ